jgi:hypothetical protein
MKVVIYGGLALLSIGLLAVGFWIHQAHNGETDPHPITAVAEHFANELGIAGIVACILAITIESLSHREFLTLAQEERSAIKKEFEKLAQQERNAIKQDVFHYVYGHSIPEEITTEIELQLLKNLFVKRNLVLVHTIEPFPANPKYVVLTTHITYELQNLTDQTQTYHLLSFSEDAPEPALQAEARFLSIKVDDCETPFIIEGDELVSSQDKNKIGGHLCVEKDIRVRPDRPARFAFSVRTLKSLDDGYDIFLCSDPTCGFDIKVHVYHLDLEVSAHAFHPETLSPALEHRPALNRHHWTIKRPVLIHQGAYVYWRPKRTAGAPYDPGRAVIKTVPLDDTRVTGKPPTPSA